MLAIHKLKVDAMKPDFDEKKEMLKNKLLYLRHNMAKFFDCDDAFIKLSDPIYTNDRFKINAVLTIINREVNSLNTLHGNTYYLDFEGEYLKREGIWYEGNFYNYDELNDFFQKISLEMKEIKQ